MKKNTGLALASWLVGFAALSCEAQSPFTVSPRIEITNGSTVLRVAFGIPTNHILYAEKLVFHLNGASLPTVFELPVPAVIIDRFSGKQKKVFTNSFEAIRLLAAMGATGFSLSVHFQGCDPENCYFPEDQIFTISPRGEIVRIEE